jgi:NADH-quinone oxidoreductase subunit C
VPEPQLDVPDVASSEQRNLREAGIEIQLSPQLRALRDHLVARYPELEVLGFRGELTLIAPSALIPELLRFCRDDPTVGCELLSDLSCVHWPGGVHRDNSQETTGWPTFEYEGDGRIEVDYLVRSISRNHAFRIRTSVPDTDPAVPSATGVYGSANFMEREAYDFFGVRFEGHPDLRRIHMPDDWEGHPQRKDYPLGGVDITYKGGHVIPPPDQRKY